MRRSPLDDRHRGLGATMTPFAGWEMPLHYGSVIAEHRAVRERCGVFDLSHLGTIRVTGEDAEACVQRAFTNDVEALDVGRAHYSLCLDKAGGIIDDLLVYRLGWGFFVVPNAANAEAVRAVLEGAGEVLRCDIADVKADMACLAVQGPEATTVCTSAGVVVDDLGYLDCRLVAASDPRARARSSARARARSSARARARSSARARARSSAWVGEEATAPPPAGGVLARSGYTGERGYELFVPAEAAPGLWDRLTEAGGEPAGLGARDTLRLEMGYPLHGNDISPHTSPVEARLGWAVKQGTGFHGEEAYTRARERAPERRLWGLRVTGRGIPRAHCAVWRDGVRVGETTSGTFSPTLGVGVALGYLDSGVEPGVQVEIEVRGKRLAAEVVRPPFVASDPKR